METEFHRGPKLPEIAKQVHLSPFHFHRRFTELLGITPKEFLLDCQIDQAKKQFLAREKDLAEIATACGFAHESHFTSRFKQATGLTPARCPCCEHTLLGHGDTISDHDVFVSYSWKDKTVADASCVALAAKRMRCWITPRDVMPGKCWARAVLAAIEDSRVIVLIYSAHANT